MHTPQVPFAVERFGCAAGMMVTASHNPKQDNGFKVYWANGAQIIPPHDEGIAASILAHLAPWKDYSSIDVLGHSLANNVSEEVATAYFQSLTSLSSRSRDANAASTLSVAYTAMHGVGRKWIERAFEQFGHPRLHIVPSQAEPDPQFSTVSFPNPEEKGALNCAQAFAQEHHCQLILANDPDADRLAVAEWLPSQSWHVFSGNEVGVLLGYWSILRWKQQQQTADKAKSEAAVLASIVSSRMLRSIAKAEGIRYYDTLTGFKWLGNRAKELRAQGVDVLFCYEEALGYCVGDILADKDGVSAAVVLTEIASELQQGWVDPFPLASSASSPVITTVHGLLQYLYAKYGLFLSYNSYVISRNPRTTDAIFKQLRISGPSGSYWTHAVGQRIVSITDVTTGYDSTAADLKSSLPLTPDSHMIMFEFENGVSVTLRTSGTEPKIKYYTEIADLTGMDRHMLQGKLTSFVDALVDEMLQPAAHGLQRA